ncbi:asparaginase [Calderihabitans maritimus]|uniref:Asparaginase n=1 Tax=Calderihabitans maritimus TaxID=1246530 RepID=A0A1Z5HPL4_9FIRM|nr:asparaginase [Calderihabitans maritimus]GAW91463.1 hypothetical protein KKC1_06250 [Calderihabitans maritimus]
MSEVLIEVTRGGLVESIHRGHAVVVDVEGNILYSVGNPYYFTYLRSAAKPLQVIPLIESGAAERFSFTPAEIAVMCGSHAGEPVHVETVKSILDKIGASPSALLCGIHRPFHRPTANRLIENREKPTELHNNCSGKHSAMLALALHHGWPLEKYLAPDHPVQKTMLDTISHMCQLPEEEIVVGTDGCGVPVFGMPLYNMALAFASLVEPRKISGKKREACHFISEAMLSNPVMVSGSGRICTELINHGRGNIVAKAGAEAVYCLGIKNYGWGVALKIEDGSQRAVSPAVIEILRQLRLLDASQLQALNEFHRPEVKNFRGETVGMIRPVFKLKHC